MKRMALLGLCLALAGCTTTVDGSASTVTGLATTKTSATATTTTTTTPPLVAPTSIEGKLLTLDELGEIADDTDMQVKQSYSEPDSGKKPVDPILCSYRIAFATSPAYFNSDRLAMAGESDRGASGNVAAQMITVYADRTVPGQVLSAATSEWTGCKADQPFTVSGGGGHWIPDELTVEDTRIGTTMTRQEKPPRSCHHVMASQANVIVETFACDAGDTAEQANEIADKILAKLPK